MQKITTAERTANVIKKCFSPAALSIIAAEMGEKIQPGEDIFQALMRAGRALDIETAVMLVLVHLDEQDSSLGDTHHFMGPERRKNNKSH